MFKKKWILLQYAFNIFLKVQDIIIEQKVKIILMYKKYLHYFYQIRKRKKFVVFTL